jgi:translation initiation factor 2 subunit 1
MPYGAVAELSEYPGKEGFVHISNVASSWVKNIRSFVSEGAIRVASVMSVDKDKKSIDLSLRKVSEQQEKRKLEDWKREKRADKLFERVCREIGEDPRKSYMEIGAKLEEKFGDLLSAFENVSVHGEEALKDLGLSDKWVQTFVKHSKESITISFVAVKGDLILTSRKSDGINAIKGVLAKVKESGVTVRYISAPKYLLEASAQEYADAKKVLAAAAETAIKSMQKAGGEGSFEKAKA